MPSTLVWLRRDLRLADNPALIAAARRGPVLPVYIHAPDETGDWAPDGASAWWLHHSLAALRNRFRDHGLNLIIRHGPSLEALQGLLQGTGADAVYWNRLYEPASVDRDRRIKQVLREAGIGAHSFNASVLYEPWAVETGQGGPYRAFTPFWKACGQLPAPPPPEPVPPLRAVPAASQPESPGLGELGLLPNIRWDRKLERYWTPGETGAADALERFLDTGLARYGTARDLPAQRGTSELSPHLHFGEISPRQILQAVEQRRAGGHGSAGAEAFLRELGWREFARHVLFHHHDFPTEPLNPRFAAFPWRDDDGSLMRAWQQGRTGFPMVDAGLRQLWETGWMHNRVRMIAGSLLVKNLRLPWQDGARWFWDTLVDADLASNSLGWQWVAGSGADAAPYFRIFNPVRQGERFDPDGTYVARWIPELARLPVKHRHAPWNAPAGVLREAGVRLGRDYPEPVVDLKLTREQALEAFQAVKTARR
jgi:deoxyribodipyrimidine photo-lyase